MSDPVLVLRTCHADRTSSHGFQWPAAGPVAAPDWSPKPECGHGLHGLLWGVGDAGLLNWDEDASWLVVAVDPDVIVDLDGKVKFPRGEVVYCGDRSGATTFVAADPRAAGKPIVAGTATAGNRGTATAGNRGTATAGYAGTATAGYAGTATAGDSGTATAGYAGTATAGDSGVLLLRYWTGRNYALAVAIVGQNGIKPNTPYRLNEQHDFVEVS